MNVLDSRVDVMDILMDSTTHLYFYYKFDYKHSAGLSLRQPKVKECNFYQPFVGQGPQRTL